MSTSVSPIAKAVHHLEAGDWQAAHAIVQKDTTTLGCWAHGIVHLVEGDLANARYWYRRAHRTLPDADTASAEIAALKHTLQTDVSKTTARAATRGPERGARGDRSKGESTREPDTGHTTLHDRNKEGEKTRVDTRSSERPALQGRSKEGQASAAPSEKASLKKGTQ